VKSEEKQTGKWSDDDTELVTDVYDVNGNKANLNVTYEKIRDGKFNVKFSPTADTKPGLYKIISTFTVDGVEHSVESEFAWGLVSLNTAKSIYKPGETAQFIIVVLDSEGHPVNDAELFMTLTDPNNQITTQSTEEEITISLQNGVYDADYDTSVEGTYHVSINAITDGIDANFDTTFDVAFSYDFDIIRTAQSVIDPTINPNSFDVVIDIESFTDADTITITESIPAVFDVETDGKVKTVGDQKIITWKKDLIDSKTTVEYTYAIPMVFPELYPLGPLEIAYASNTFTEARPWYVAADPAGSVIPTTNSAACNSATCSVTTGTLPGGTNTIILVAGASGSTDMGSPLWKGNTMNTFTGGSTYSANGANVALWWYPDSATTAGTASFTHTNGRGGISVFAITGADTTSPESGYNTATGTGTTAITVALDGTAINPGASGDTLYGVASFATGGTATANTNNVLAFSEVNCGANTCELVGAYVNNYDTTTSVSK